MTDHISFPFCYVIPRVVIFNCTKNQSIFTFCSLQIGRATEALRVVNQVTDAWEVPTQLSLAALFVQWFTGWRSLLAAELSPSSSCCFFLSSCSSKNMYIFRRGGVAAYRGSCLFVATCIAGGGDSIVTNPGGRSLPLSQFPAARSSTLKGWDRWNRAGRKGGHIFTVKSTSAVVLDVVLKSWQQLFDSTNWIFTAEYLLYLGVILMLRMLITMGRAMVGTLKIPPWTCWSHL